MNFYFEHADAWYLVKPRPSRPAESVVTIGDDDKVVIEIGPDLSFMLHGRHAGQLRQTGGLWMHLGLSGTVAHEGVAADGTYQSTINAVTASCRLLLGN